MKYVIALDVGTEKNTILIYDSNHQYEFEGELYHRNIDFGC